MLHQFYERIFTLKIIKSLFFFTLLVFVISLYHREIQQDEPWFGEQGYWLVKEGNVKLKSMPGIYNWTENMLIYHKLFVWMAAVLMLTFGWSVYIFKVFILVFFIVCAYYLFHFIRRRFPEYPEFPWLTVLLLFITPELIHRSFMFRPEVVVMTLGFLSFYTLRKFIETNAYSNVILAGACSGLLFLTHLNAVVFAITGFCFLIYCKRWKGLFVFSGVTIALCLVYTIGLWSAEAVETYTYQLRNWPTHQSSFGGRLQGDGIFDKIWINLLRVLNEHKRYFWDHDVWGISILFLVTLLARFKYLKKTFPYLLPYTLILMAALAVFSSGHAPRYLTYLMPFMILIMASVIVSLKFEDKKVLKSILLVVFTAQLVFASIAFVTVFKRSRDHVFMHSEVLSVVEEGSNVLGPWEMIYNEIDKYNIHSFKTYEYIEDFEKRKLTQEELLQLAAEKFDMDYIVLDQNRKIDKEFNWFRDWNIEDNAYFETYKNVQDYLVLKRKK